MRTNSSPDAPPVPAEFETGDAPSEVDGRDPQAFEATVEPVPDEVVLLERPHSRTRRRRILLHRAVNRAADVPSLVGYDFWVALELSRQRLWERFLNPHLRPAGPSIGFDVAALLLATLLFLFGSNVGGAAVLLYVFFTRGTHERQLP